MSRNTFTVLKSNKIKQNKTTRINVGNVTVSCVWILDDSNDAFILNIRNLVFIEWSAFCFYSSNNVECIIIFIGNTKVKLKHPNEAQMNLKRNVFYHRGENRLISDEMCSLYTVSFHSIDMNVIEHEHATLPCILRANRYALFSVTASHSKSLTDHHV